jgi:hypothetical protein
MFSPTWRYRQAWGSPTSLSRLSSSVRTRVWTRVGIVRPLVASILLDALITVAIIAMQLARERAEVRLVSPVLQVASDLRLLSLCSAAPHRVDPLSTWPGLSRRENERGSPVGSVNFS